MTSRQSTVPTVRQRVIVTLRGPGLDTCETSAVVDAVGHEGTFDIRLRGDVDKAGLREGAGIAVDRMQPDGLWRLQARVVDVGGPPGPYEGAGWRGPRVRLSPVGSARRIDVRRFHRLHVWTPLRRVVLSGPDLDSAGSVRIPDASESEQAQRDLARITRVERAFSIGAGGLAFVAHDPVEAGDVLLVHLEDPVLDIQALARVVWTHHASPSPGHAGIEFLGLHDADQDRLLEYVLRGRRTRGRARSGSGVRRPRTA